MNEVTLANFLAAKGETVGTATVKNYKASILKLWRVCSSAVVASQSEVVQMMFNSMTLNKPIKAKYKETWDVLKLVNYVEKLAESDKPIDVRDTLILLLRIYNLRRCGDCFNILFDKVDQEACTFVQLRRKRDKGVTENETAPIPYQEYKEYPKLCLKNAFRRYFAIFTNVRKAGTRRLFLQMTGQEISAATIRSRSQFHMVKAGVPSYYKAHSIRMAAASRMLDMGIPIEDVMKIGDWTSLHVFLVFYHRSRVQTNVPKAILGRVEDVPEKVVPVVEPKTRGAGRTRGHARQVGGGSI